MSSNKADTGPTADCQKQYRMTAISADIAAAASQAAIRIVQLEL
jgi:hypothetical protein